MRIAYALITLMLLVPASTMSAQQPNMQDVPTTKVLAIGKLSGPRDAAWRDTMPKEVHDTVDLYLRGKIDQWYVRKDGQGIVFLMNVSSVEEAHALLERLLLGQAHMMSFDLIALGPLTPLRFLLNGPASVPPSVPKP